MRSYGDAPITVVGDPEAPAVSGRGNVEPQAVSKSRICRYFRVQRNCAARRYGLLTRPVRDVIVLMPPYCINEAQLSQAVEAIGNAIQEVCG